MSSSLAAHPQPSRFLQTGENRFMSWLHDITANNFYQVKTLLFSSLILITGHERDSIIGNIEAVSGLAKNCKDFIVVCCFCRPIAHSLT